MTVLVTGGAGLIGMALRRHLAQAGMAAVAVDRTRVGRDDPALELLDLADTAGLEALAHRDGVTAIAHCGAISGPMLAKGQPDAIVAANIQGTANMLDLARRLGVRRFVLCSSISVYGDTGDATLVEEMALHPGSVYAASKVAGEALVEAYGHEYGLHGVSLRIARVYGPYRRGDCHIRTMIEAAAAGRPVRIPCDPAFVYHYVMVDDVARAIIAALTVPALPSRVYNVGSGEVTTMPQVVQMARAVLPGLQVDLVAGQDDVPDRQAAFDIGRIARELGVRPAWPLARGIAACAAAVAERPDI